MVPAGRQDRTDTLAAVLPDIESTSSGPTPGYKVYVAGQKRGLTATIKRAFRRRSRATIWPGENAVLAALGYFGLSCCRLVLAILASLENRSRTTE